MDADSDVRKTGFLMFICKEMYIIKQEWKWGETNFTNWTDGQSQA